MLIRGLSTAYDCTHNNHTAIAVVLADLVHLSSHVLNLDFVCVPHLGLTHSATAPNQAS